MSLHLTDSFAPSTNNDGHVATGHFLTTAN